MNILILDNDFASAARLNGILVQRGFSAQWSTLDPAKREEVLNQHFDVIFTELAVAPEEAEAAVVHAQMKQPHSQVIVYTSQPDLRTAVRALREGAVDYLVKGQDEGKALEDAMERATVRRGLNVENQRLHMELSNRNGKAADLVTRDGLTGIYNFRFFAEYTAKEIERAERRSGRVCMILLEIEGLREFAAIHGRKHEDDLLKHLSALFLRNIRASDLVARSGAAEFIFLLTDTPPMGAEMVAKKLRTLIADIDEDTSGTPVILKPRLGISVFPENGRKFEDLLTACEAALAAPDHDWAPELENAA